MSATRFFFAQYKCLFGTGPKKHSSDSPATGRVKARGQQGGDPAGGPPKLFNTPVTCGAHGLKYPPFLKYNNFFDVSAILPIRKIG